MANVGFIVEEVRKLLPQYELISDCLQGETKVKSKRATYLPKPNVADTSKDNAERYNAYLTRAVFYNVAQRTLAGLVGQIFLRDPNVEVPTELDILNTDATGSGVTLQQLAQEASSFGLSYGRAGLYVDYPDTARPEATEGSTVEEAEAGLARPTIQVISPLDCINYRVAKRGAKTILTLVVFKEEYTKEDDGFETKKSIQWRALRLINNQYVIEIYRDRQGNKPDEVYYPKDSKGVPLDEIPFIFIGSMTNDPKCDLPPLYDLCSINIAHYRNSADYEEAVYMLGQPTPWFSGLTEEWVEKVLGGKVMLGSRAAIALPVDGSAGLLQVEPNTLAKEAMDQKEAQMLALGAKLVEGSQVERTATEADYDNTSETSILASVAKNVGAGMKWALEKACLFTGANPAGIAYDMNTEFDLTNLTPDERRSIIAEWQAGAITFEEMRASFRRAGIAFLKDEEAKEQLEEEAADNLDLEVEKTAALAKANPQQTKPPVAN